MLAHQLAAEFHRILADRLRQFIHEAFHIDRVLVHVDAAPEAGRNVGVAHRMLDQQVRHGVADRRVAGRTQALERGRVHAVHQRRRTHREQDRLAGQSHMQRREIVVGIEGPGQFALRDRMELALRHVLFARPQQLDRRAGHLLGDENRLPDIIGHAAPAEAAAEDMLVHLAFFGRQSRRFHAWRQTPLRRSACRTRPRICPVYRAPWRSSAPSAHGSGRDSCRPPRPSWRQRQSQPWRRRSGCRYKPAAHCRGPRPAIWRSTRWRLWRSRLRPRRSAAHRARSWRATRYRRRRRRCCR